jgi:hypothetical protein
MAHFKQKRGHFCQITLLITANLIRIHSENQHIDLMLLKCIG